MGGGAVRSEYNCVTMDAEGVLWISRVKIDKRDENVYNKCLNDRIANFIAGF